MSEEKRISPRALEHILNEAVDLTENRVSYITNIRFNISNNEATLDLYYVSQNPTEPAGQPVAHRLHRVVVPLALAKNIGHLLVDAMTNWEDVFGVTLPLTPAKAEGDDHDNG